MKPSTLTALTAAAFAWAAASAARAQSDVPRAALDEYDKRARAIAAEEIDGRVSIARELRDKGLHVWARREYAKILALSPDQKDARRALGYELDGGQWVRRGETIPTVDEKMNDNQRLTRAERYHERLDFLASKLAGKHLSLAAWCAENGMAELGRQHLLAAHDCAPEDEKIKAALGFATDAIMPIPSDPGTLKLFTEFRTGDKDVALGEPRDSTAAWGPDTIKDKVVVVHGRHVGLESTWIGKETNVHTKGWLEQLARRGDHAYVMAHKLLLEDAPTDEPRYQFAYLGDYEFKELTKWSDPENKNPHLLEPDCTAWRGDHTGQRASRRDEAEVPLKDPTHLVPQFVLTRRLWGTDNKPSDKAALIEGFAILCEFMGNQSNSNWCSGGPSTTAGGARQDYRQFAAVQAKTFEDYPLEALFKAGFNSLATEGNGAAKAASILEWRFALGQKEAVEFVRALVVPKPDVAEVVRTHTGMSVEQFEEAWRRWAIVIAEADFSAALAEGKTERRCPNCTYFLDITDYKFAMISGILKRCPDCKQPLPKELQKKPRK